MKRLIALFPLIALGGCVVHEREHYVVRERPPVVEERVIEDDRPLVTGPGVVVVDVEPAPPERVYIYEPGYPPGVYLYGGFYYYGGHRYERDVFITRVVNVNVRERRYVNVVENRNIGHRFEEQHRTMYVATNGRRDPDYLHKLRAGEKEHQKAYQYGEKLKAAGAKDEQKKYEYGEKLKAAGAKEEQKKFEAGQQEKLKAARYEADQRAKAGRYEGDQRSKAGAYVQDQKAKAGAAKPQQDPKKKPDDR